MAGEIVGVNGADNGSVLVEFRCDGDPDVGEGEQREIILTGNVTVLGSEGSEAFTGDLEFGEAIKPEPQTEEVPA